MPRNCALLQDELILEVITTLEGEKPLGPDALDSLLGLIEACVIHEEVWFDPMPEWAGGGIPSPYVDHEFVNGLLREGVLRRPPASDDLDMLFADLGTDFDMVDFIKDLRFTLSPFNVKGPSEGLAYEMSAQIVQEVPKAFGREWLTLPDDPEAHEEMVRAGLAEPRGSDGLSLLQLGFSEPELIVLEGWNGQGRALSRYAGLLGLQLYLTPRAVPHLLASRANQNQLARRVFQHISAQAEAQMTADIGGTGYSYHSIPPIATIVLAQPIDTAQQLVDAILHTRYELRAVRSFLTDFETRWAQCDTVRERKKLQQEVDDGIAAIATVALGSKDRLLYRFWDLVKDPTKVLEALGDMLVARGRKESAIGRVQGLRAFWNAALDSPPTETVHVNLRRLAKGVADDRTWQASRVFQQNVADAMSRGEWGSGPSFAP